MCNIMEAYIIVEAALLYSKPQHLSRMDCFERCN